MDNDELIKQGTSLLKAIEDGRLGFDAGELRELQRNYEASKKWTHGFTKGVYIASAFFLVLGIACLTVTIMSSTDSFGSLAGPIFIGLGIALPIAPRYVRKKAVQYVTFVTTEYPKHMKKNTI